MNNPKKISWINVTLQEIVDERKNSIKRGPWGGSLKKEFFVKKGYKVYEQKNVIYQNFKIGNYYINEQKFQELKDFELFPGDLVISCSGTFGKIAIVPEKIEKGIINQALLKISFDNKKIIIPYIKYLFQSEHIQKQFFGLTHGSAIKNIVSVSIIKKMKFEIPPLLEQQKIAYILSKVDELIQKIEQIIEQTQRLKKGLMQRLLTKGIGHTKFKKTELGEIPEEWQISNLMEYTTKIGSGITPRGGSKVYQSTGIPFIRSQNVHFDGLHLEDVAYISEKIDNEMKNTRIQPFDILLNITGASIGRCTFVPEELKHGNVNQHVCIIRPKKEIDPIFLTIFLSSNSGQKLIHSTHHGLSREGLTFSQIAEFSIPIPSIYEQKQIVRFLRSINSVIKYYNSFKNNFIDIKKGLMQQLLTGKIRVKV
jgi:type I restriction enzyme, S subunit